MTPAKSSTRPIRDYAIAVLGAVVVAFIVRSLFLEAYRIPSAAMRPTLEAGDTIFVAKWPFGIRMPWNNALLRPGRMPHYGEVVVFSPPLDLKRDYVKRVVGLPGDTVALRRGQLLVNGKNLTVLPKGGAAGNALCGEERFTNKRYSVCWEPPLVDDFGPEKVPPDSVFVLGDLRSRTPDSRKQISWGTVPVKSIKARGLVIWLSMEPAKSSKSGWFSRIRFERMFRRIE